MGYHFPVLFPCLPPPFVHLPASIWVWLPGARACSVGEVTAMNVVPLLPHALQHQMRKNKIPDLPVLAMHKGMLCSGFYTCMHFAETRGTQAFPISDPTKHCCGVTRGPDAAVLSSRSPRQGCGSPLKEASGWGCDHSLWWKILFQAVSF